MHHFRKKPSSPASPANSPQRAPTPPIVEYIKKELATFHPRAKDRRALAASSSAIALSIASPSCDPMDTVPDESGSSKESSWMAAYGAARIAIETTKESSDMCLPLKAVVGALSVLIKNYDQTTANKGQIKDIEARIESLVLVLASPVGDKDTEEKARREILRKKLAEIVSKLRPLSDQHELLKFLKNTDHASALNGFVQDLANAVTDYQTSIQQSIYGNTKRIDGSTKEIGDDTKKITETTKRTDDATRRIEEAAKKTDQATERIDQTTEKIDQTTKNIDENTRNIIEAADLELLGKLDPVRNAGYQAGHHDTCLRGTREAVLDWIVRWTEDPPDRYVFWLNGLAGTGKSTIAQTFSEKVARNGTLGASFFCSRDYLDRKELKNIFPTLAYQLACRYPSFRAKIIRAIRQDPTIAQSSLLSQLKDLIIDPLSSTNISCVIVVDALDECVDDQPASAILSVLGRYVKQVPSIKFFITGRPEPRIRTGFRLPLLEPLTQIFLLHGVELSSVDEDIRLYLQEKLNAIARRRSDSDLSNPWPCDEDLATLTKKSSGLFIFASTLVRFIGSEHHEPDERLRLIVALPDSTIHEGRTGIDPLYTQVLVHAFSDIEETTVFANLRKVLGAVVLAFNPLSRVQISQILGISPSLIATTLRHLHSVLLVPTEDSKEIRVFHKSFPDFLQDCGRCKDSKFFVDPSVQHGDMALGCLELMKKLKSNPCNLPNFVMNRDAVDLPSLLEDKVGSAMRYACGYWAMHVRSSPTTDNYATKLIESATEFLKDVIPWIEVLSLENRLESVIHSIYNLFDWLSVVQVDTPTSDLRTLAQDCLRFTMHFFPAIQQSALHVYHSALPLSPRSSVFSSTAHQEAVIKEFYGCSDTWGTVVRTIKSSIGLFTCMTTFGHWIAAACDDGTVGVYDSVTGVLRLSLSPPDPVQEIRGSPDGSILFCIHKGPSITTWDIQTGGLIHTFALKHRAGGVAICSRGSYFAWGLSDGSVKTWEVANRTEVSTFGSGSLVTHLCWLEPGEQLVAVDEVSVRVWDVITRKVLRRFTMTGSVGGVVYAQKLNKFAIVAASETECIVTVVDSRTGTSFADRTPRRISCIAFSQITKEFVCGVDIPGLELFNIRVGGWKRFDHPVAVTSVSTLSNGTVVADVAGSGIQLLDLDQGPPTSQQLTSPALTVDVLDEGRIIAVLSTVRDQIVLLELVTMSQLLNIPVRKTHSIPTDRTAVLCASHEHRMAVYSFEERARTHLQLWVFGNELQEWAVEMDKSSLSGEISPSGARLVTFRDVGTFVNIHIRDTQNGRIMGYLLGLSWLPHPLAIKFGSEDQFYFQYNAHHIPFLISSTVLGAHSHSIARYQQRPFVGRPQRRYDVDDTREWVIGFSKRVCWIPAGYIGSVQHSYCWAGDTLIMAGQDGVLRKLTFRDSFETNFEGYDGWMLEQASVDIL